MQRDTTTRHSRDAVGPASSAASDAVSATATATTATTATPSAGEARWQVRLLGAVDAFDGAQRIVRFPSRAVTALLARVALAPERAHSREELVELLWPGVALDVGRNRLRQALSTLKSLLEPAGMPGTAVLQADRLAVRVVPGALACDAVAFERAARAGQADAALALYGGDLMPGFYDEWIDAERQRLAHLHGGLRTPRHPMAQAAWPSVAAAGVAALNAVLADDAVPSAAPPVQPSTAPLIAPSVTPSIAPSVAPSVAPSDPSPGAALPAYLTRLFGAAMATARLRAQVLGRRLVTLLGPGGSGKTRLGVEVAQALRTQPLWADRSAPDSVPPAPFARIAFVPLVACDDALQMLDAIARALQLSGVVNGAANAGAGAIQAALQRLVAALAGQRVLLVLDNFEQLVGHGDVPLGQLLAQLPALHVLVTSRRALGLDGESCVGAEPLSLPPADAGLAAAAANPAVALFVDRARAVRTDFHLAARNHAAIVALVRLLHGMPLAIELAASRVRSFGPAEMVQLLASGDAAGPSGGAHLALLARSGPRSGHDPRHASMAQVIAWSWRLLDLRAQQVLGALTLFPADATAAAVAAVVAAPGGQGHIATALVLDELVGHSLVRCVLGGVASGAASGAAAEAADAKANDGAAPRFGLVEPVREFVQAQLAAAAPADTAIDSARDTDTDTDAAAAQRLRLRSWLLAWAQALGPHAAPARIAPELPLVHAVLAQAQAGPDAADPAARRQALQLALALRNYWDSDGLPGRVQAALRHALSLLPASDAALHADLHELLAYLRFEAGFAAEALAHADAAVQWAGNDPSRRARALVRRAWVEVAGNRGDDAAAPSHARLTSWLDDALATAQACGDREAQARALHQLAVLASHVQDDMLRAEQLLHASQDLWLALGDQRKAYARLRNRAQCWARMGRQDDALASYLLCEQAARDDGDWVGQIDSLISLGSLLAQQRQWQAALDANRRCLALCWQRWHRHGLGYALWNPPRLLARLRRPEQAIQLMAFAATFWVGSFGPLASSDQTELRRVRALVRAQIGAARTEALWLQGATLDVASAVALALRD